MNTPNFVASANVQAYLHMYDVTCGLRARTVRLLLNTIFEGQELVDLPQQGEGYCQEQHHRILYQCHQDCSGEIGVSNRTNTILQSAFFRITEVIHRTAVEQNEEVHRKELRQEALWVRTW